MMIMSIILFTVTIILSIIFLGNAAVALAQVKINKEKGYYNNYLLICGGFSYLLIVCFCVVAYIEIIETRNKFKEIEQYEIIQEPVYRKIK